MFNKLFILVIKGLLTILPFVITIYLLTWLINTTETLLSTLIAEAYYFPGLGIGLALLVLATIGIIVNLYVIKLIIEKANSLFDRVPLIKTVFGAIKDAVDLFQVKQDQNTKKAVSVQVSEGVNLIGFITGDSIAEVLYPGQNKTAVYVPFSYQIGGYTLYLDADKITELSIDVETAMRIAVTGGNSIKQAKPAKPASEE
ncbi:DUF502 domain-containing protein [Brumicola pallidula]|jgi:uncharacterized membrane protein|uniref:DUF502 domain-containing protein n=1 Tax=Brumicola pallidula DSM 14239 = ACAM 615 TaxID=1121922 RepID=K6ZF64_9ALTE|nr:DUF502 domain-containing protein [Glaciecola pallidula]GAC27563.1 hypothetical protein GPAL_0683 [Glaciecola pallidula DSM 14239 = ACAM 615]